MEKTLKGNFTLPEEIDKPEVESEFGRFKEFLRTCMAFNKEDFKPTIKLRK